MTAPELDSSIACVTGEQVLPRKLLETTPQAIGGPLRVRRKITRSFLESGMLIWYGRQ
jgi:hypothetical protein